MPVALIHGARTPTPSWMRPPLMATLRSAAHAFAPARPARSGTMQIFAQARAESGGWGAFSPAGLGFARGLSDFLNGADGSSKLFRRGAQASDRGGRAFAAAGGAAAGGGSPVPGSQAGDPAAAAKPGVPAEGAASGAPAGDDLKLLSGVLSLPHPEKELRGGEDSHFIGPEGLTAGVADGVGGWAEVGVDAGEYARRLMAEAARRVNESAPGEVEPLGVLVDAYTRTRVIGSSTACVMVLKDGQLRAANLGDSGFLVVRGGTVVFRCPPQQHGFNFPYQLGTESTDRPEAADMFTVPVAEGDVVVMGTDGLFDNVFDREVAEVVSKAVKAGYGPQQVANAIGTLARHRAGDQHNLTPFAVAARDAGLYFQGGKMDDITVVVSFVVPENVFTKSRAAPAGAAGG